ncbi:MAG TPA: NAD(P)-dependent oxidoreductase [Burkholderiaceae bacterium]|nr:NAD(P)-dependent oxidoreductase [Burkholderiaceae bacterium]
MKVAVIGLGAMGAACARNLLARGFDVCGADLRTQPLEALAAAGGRRAGSPREAAAGADVIVTFVVNAAQVEAVVLGRDGVAESMGADAVLVQCATVPASFAAALGATLAQRGLAMVDAPVSGGVLRAGDGTLSVMASGPRDAMRRAQPLLDAIGQHVYDFGETHGAGSTVKTINQLLCGVHLVALGEALALGRRAGLDPARLLEVYTRSAASSWMMGDRGPRALQEAPPTNSAVDIFVKDLGLVLDTGRALNFPLPLSSVAYQQFVTLSARGQGGIDDSQLWRAYPLPDAAPRQEPD